MTVFSAASLMAPFVLGRDAFDIAAAHADMRRRYVPLGHLATSLFDIALHDGKAKSLGQPIFRMLGAARDEIPAYASSPLLPTDRDYVDYCPHDARPGLSRDQAPSLLRVRRRPAPGPRDRRGIRRTRHCLEPGCGRDVHARRGAAHGAGSRRRRLGVLRSTAPGRRPVRLQDAGAGARYRCRLRRKQPPGPASDRACAAHGRVGSQPLRRDRHRRLYRRQRGDGGHARPWQGMRSSELGLHADAGGQPAPHARPPELQLLRAGHARREIRVRRRGRSFARTPGVSSARAACRGSASRWTGT